MNDMNLIESPLPRRGKGEASFDWKTILKVIIAILTAIAGTLGISAMV